EFTHGSAVVPLPVPLHVPEPASSTSRPAWMMFGDICAPPAEFTVSTMLVAVRSSPRSSLLLRIVYEHTYRSPTEVGVSHPFENPIPCSPCAEAAAIQITAASTGKSNPVALKSRLRLDTAVSFRSTGDRVRAVRSQGASRRIEPEATARLA